jgi:hypothetical protein
VARLIENDPPTVLGTSVLFWTAEATGLAGR